MDRVAFSLRHSADGGVEVHLRVNDTSLGELALMVEGPAAAAAGQPDLAGDYRGLHPGDLHSARHYLDRPGPTVDDATVLLGCPCGEWGCWPLCAQIRVTKDAVVWEGFANPFRREWDRAGLGPFRFDRTAYEEALDDLDAAMQRLR